MKKEAQLLRQYSQYFKQKEWQKAIDVLKKLLVDEPDSHWILTNIGISYYEMRRYKTALRYSKKALELAPNCPLVLWDYACALDMLDRKMEAIKIWKGLLRRGVEKAAYGDCNEGIRWAKSLLNDSRYRIGQSYLNLGKRKLALRYLREHLSQRKRGLPSIFSRKEVLKNIKSTEQLR
jgi:tetratricopeptide (TPR) repeat protein